MGCVFRHCDLLVMKIIISKSVLYKEIEFDEGFFYKLSKKYAVCFVTGIVVFLGEGGV